MVDGVLTGLSFKRLLTGAVILNGWAPRPMENGTESEITILDIQGSELGDGDTNLDFTGPVVALDGGRSPAQPKIKIDQLSSSNQKVEHSILFKDVQIECFSKLQDRIISRELGYQIAMIRKK
ncbi:uncharacterized protein LOC112495595 isoform X2 [Citrus sinensis]|uniref:uncharacterized protein LOC112096820 isoform X2 n=1 Tax=Citrus clementina TaxID=85681 RepID=UPI000CED4C68|nr:uncharacterized protein LOC112096820 isoform X2 [Citrus x clementina]XP_024947890.2 uncharacterized protein LOC112495595 isoform X2 [Citrus sinensis]